MNSFVPQLPLFGALLLPSSLAVFYMLPDAAALVPDASGLFDKPGQPQPAQELAKVAPIGCVRQAAAPNTTTTTAPQLVCRAKICPGNCRPKRT